MPTRPTTLDWYPGTSGHSLHTNGEPINPGRGYYYANGRSYCEAVTVNW